MVWQLLNWGERRRETYTPYISIYSFGWRRHGLSEKLLMLLWVCLAGEREKQMGRKGRGILITLIIAMRLNLRSLHLLHFFSECQI